MAISAQATCLSTANGQGVAVLVADAFDSRNRCTLVLYNDGMGESETSLYTDSLKNTTIQALVDAGCIVASTNSHGDSWGSQDALDDYAALYAYCAARWRVDDVAILSQSMGGNSGLLSYAGNLFPEARCWAGVYPSCNLQASYDLNFSASITAAYGISGDYAAKTAGHDPNLLDESVWSAKYLRAWASTGDTVIPKATHSDLLIPRAVTGGAAEAVIVACTGEHGDASHFDPPALLAFMRRAGCAV